MYLKQILDLSFYLAFVWRTFSAKIGYEILYNIALLII